MSFVSLAVNPTAVNVEGRGILNGYKVTAVLHSGRKISLSKNSYYYIPFTNQLVSYRGSMGRQMLISHDGKYNFQEKLEPRGVVPFKVDAQCFHEAAMNFSFV
jgi:hypothetical protein